MNDEPERHYTTELPKVAEKFGVWGQSVKDNGHKKDRALKVPFDTILCYPQKGAKMVVIEGKKDKKDISDDQRKEAIRCATLGIPHFFLWICPFHFALTTMDRDGKQRSRPEWVADTLAGIILKIGEII